VPPSGLRDPPDHLATSIDALNGIADATLGTSLLPGEDRAPLTGPDRIELYTHEAHSLAEALVI
jgi:hypothetical protein